MRFLRSNTRSGLSQYDCRQSHTSVLYFTHYSGTGIICSGSGAILSESLMQRWFWTVPAPKAPPHTPCWPNPVWCEGHDPPRRRNYIRRRQVIMDYEIRTTPKLRVLMTTTTPKQLFNQYNRTQGIQLHGLLDSDSFSRQAAMTIQFKNHLQVPMTAGHSPTQALKCCWCLSNGPETRVVLHSWLYKGSNCLQSDFGLCLLTTHLTQTSAHWDLPDRNKPHCGRLCGTAARG